MAEGIHSLYGDIKRFRDGEWSTDSGSDTSDPLTRPKQTALTLGLDEVEELIHQEKFDEALELVEEEWRAGDYERDPPN